MRFEVRVTIGSYERAFGVNTCHRYLTPKFCRLYDGLDKKHYGIALYWLGLRIYCEQ